jgi:tRNA (guanosine-2'-O-)-methyltransferase
MSPQPAIRTFAMEIELTGSASGYNSAPQTQICNYMTPDRFRRLRAVLDRRQPDLTVVLDNVHKPHNFSAIVRSCDAVGVFEAHAVWPDPRLRLHRLTSGGAGKWVNVHTHTDVTSAIKSLRSQRFQVIAAHISQRTVNYLDVDFTRPTAILLGAELTGVSDAALTGADQHVAIPMAGHVESLNVSVAAAVLLFEAQRQRLATGNYSPEKIPAQRYRKTLFEWAQPEVAAYCRRHDKPYPELTDEGDVCGNEWRV